MRIEVLGPGCAKCEKLYAETERAIAESGVVADLVKVEKVDEIVSYGVLFTPALVIDGAVQSEGRVLGQREIVALISTNANTT